MRTLRVRNWQKFQHYKDRNPPWIKLHVEILSSRDWTMLADASKLLAIVCMVVAARDNGELPNDPEYIKRVAYLDKLPNLKPLIECGFLEILQADASDCKQPQAEFRPEEEKEQRREEEEYIGHFEKFWDQYPKKVAKKEAERAFRAALKKSSIEKILAALHSYRLQMDGKKPEYIAHAATWLNGERWNDQAGTDTGLGIVVDMSAFNSPEEVEFQNRMKEKYGYG